MVGQREWWAKGCHPCAALGRHARLPGLELEGWRRAHQYRRANYAPAPARSWRNYFWPHSRTALRQVGLSDRHRYARRVLRWIRGNDKAEISVKDIRREALGQKLDAEQTTNLLQGLVKAAFSKRLRPAFLLDQESRP